MPGRVPKRVIRARTRTKGALTGAPTDQRTRPICRNVRIQAGPSRTFAPGADLRRPARSPGCVVARMRMRATPDAAHPGVDQARSRGSMSLSATARSIPGTLRQEVVIDGRHRLITDQPERYGGDGSGPSPHELLPAALAACVTVTLVQYGRTKGWDLGEVTVDVDYDNRSKPRRVDCVIRFGRELSDEQVERLAKVARACPLRRSIDAGFEFAERIELPVAGGSS